MYIYIYTLPSISLDAPIATTDIKRKMCQNNFDL